MKVKILYGNEFWDFLEKKLNTVRKRVFIASAFFDFNILKEISEKLPKNVTLGFMSRKDQIEKNIEELGSLDRMFLLSVPEKTFHGKLFLFDNSVVIGSQNLYRPKSGVKEGEYSVLLDFEKSSFATSIVYKSMFVILQQLYKEDIYAVDKKIINFYNLGTCPFCGGEIRGQSEVKWCPEYGGVVTNWECVLYGEDGACKYCRYREPEDFSCEPCYLCEGCGLGVLIKDGSFVYNPFKYPDKEELKKAKGFLRFLTFLSENLLKGDLYTFCREMGFLGNIYRIEVEDLEWFVKSEEDEDLV